MMKTILSSFLLIFVTPTFMFASANYTISALSAPDGGSLTDVSGASPYGAVGNSLFGDPSQFSAVLLPTLWQGGQSALLPTNGNPQGYATAINANGVAVGVTYQSTTDQQPAVWQNGQLQNLSTLTMPGGAASAINNSGVIAGRIDSDVSGNYQSQAVIWNHGQTTVLGNFQNVQTWASSINNNGQALLNETTSSGINGINRVWIWSDGALTQVASLGGPALRGNQINDQGEVVGGAITADGAEVAYFFQGDISTALPQVPGDVSETAYAVNNSGEIVGRGDIGALLWENGQVFSLADLIPADSGWTLTDATAILDDGTIFGDGIFNGEPQAFELTPNGAGSNTATPEPASASLLLLGTTLLLRRKRRVVEIEI